jgi:hypothetical protein
VDPTLRLFLTTFVLVLSIGYGVGLFFVEHTTSFSPEGVREEFAGSRESNAGPELKFAKSTREMYVFVHNHVLSLTMVFFCLGTIFYFSSIVSPRFKKFLLVEPLIAIVTTFGGIALVRLVAEEFTWLVIISGISLFFCFSAMAMLILKELWTSSRTR